MIDTELIHKARNADLLQYLRFNGYQILKSSTHEYRLIEHDSLVISNNKWYWFSRDTGGNTLDFLIKYEGKEFTEAVSILTNQNLNYSDPPNCKTYNTNAGTAQMQNTHIELLLPPESKDYQRVFAYLHKTRKIDKVIISDLIKQKKLYESNKHNCVFIGTDREGNIRFASERGTLSGIPFRIDCPGSDKRFCFHLEGKSDTVFVFEAPIDALSHATLFKMKKLDYEKDHRVSLGCLGIAALTQYLKDRPDIKNVVLCLDNDQWGLAASVKLMKTLKEKGYSVQEEMSRKKDYNEDLVEVVKKQQLEKTL